MRIRRYLQRAAAGEFSPPPESIPMSDLVSLTIDPKTVQAIVQAQIQAAIVAQFNNAPGLMERIVESVITRKVDSEGKVNSYDSYNKFTLVESLCTQAIKATAEAAMREWVAEHKPSIVAAIRKQMNANKAQMVKAFCDAAERAISPQFNVNCNLTQSQH